MFATQQRGSQAGAILRSSQEYHVESEEVPIVGVLVTTGSRWGGMGAAARGTEARGGERVAGGEDGKAEEKSYLRMQCEVSIIILVGHLSFFIMRVFQHVRRPIT